VFSGVSQKQLMRGVAVVKQAIDKQASVKTLLNLLNPDAINEVLILSEGKPICLLNQEKIAQIVLNGQLYMPISHYLTQDKHNMS
jgi:predicted transcriptional regulator